MRQSFLHRCLRFSLIVGSAMALHGCGTSTPNYVFTGSQPVVPVTAPRTIAGQLNYERLLPLSVTTPDDDTRTPASLDFAHPILQPCRFVRVQLLDADQKVLDETHADALGRYSLTAPPSASQVKVRLFAETVDADGSRAEGSVPAIRVQDNTNDDALYAVESVMVDVRETGTLDVELPSGYDPQGGLTPGVVRSSAPFACLDGILTGYLYFQEGGLEDRSLPTCLVNWTPSNRPEDSEPGEDLDDAIADGRIGTSSFRSESNQLSILGFAEADTDEFDWHIMIHEFGHWVQFNGFRDNNPGGSHGVGELKDPCLAFSEGFGNALGGLALSDAVYKDTTALGGFSYSMECNLSKNTNINPGWFSEATVGEIVFDLFDPVRQEGGASNYNDRAQLPVRLLLSALRGQADSPALTTVFSFLAGLRQAGLTNEQTEQVAELLAFESPRPGFGLNSTEAFGEGEIHNGTLDSLPVYRDAQTLIDAGNFALTLPGQSRPGIFNSLQGQRRFKFQGDGRPVTVTVFNSTSTIGGVGGEIFENGRSLDPSTTTDDDADDHDDEIADPHKDDVATVATKRGATYVVLFINTGTETATTDISIAHAGGTTP